MKKQFIILIICLSFSLNSEGQTITDIDNNVYNTIAIGNQTWMQENLKTVHYNNGDPITHIPDNDQWWWLTTSAYCNFDNDTNYVPTYGRLYNGFVVSDSRNVCPVGWHVPSETEWRQLFTFLGGDSLAGGKLKESGTSHWTNPNIDATNLSGFTALPNGFRGISVGTGCTGITMTASFWGTNVYATFLSFNNGYIDHAGGNANAGLGIRCLADAPNSVTDYGVISELKVFPNPAKNQLHIEMLQQKIAFINMYDLQGVNVLRQNVNSNAKMISVSHLANGTYLLVVALKSGEKTIRKITIAD